MTFIIRTNILMTFLSHSHRNFEHFYLTFRKIFEKILRFTKIQGYPNGFSGLIDSRDITGYPEWDIPLALTPLLPSELIIVA